MHPISSTFRKWTAMRHAEINLIEACPIKYLRNKLIIIIM